MKSTDSINGDFELLETALARFGSIVTIDQFAQVFKGSRNYLRIRLSVICDKGWLFRIRKGLYIISDLATRGSLSISHYAVVNLLVENAYISFESALQFHGLYDQLPGIVASITTSRHKDKSIDGFNYTFLTTQPNYFYGWETHVLDGITVKMASREKALVDLIQFHRNRYAVDLVLEKLTDLRVDWDIELFTNLILRANVATQRVMGFLFDLTRIDSTLLHNVLKNQRGTSCVTASKDNLYSSKWNLYYDPYFSKYA